MFCEQSLYVVVSSDPAPQSIKMTVPSFISPWTVDLSISKVPHIRMPTYSSSMSLENRRLLGPTGRSQPTRRISRDLSTEE